MRNRVVFDTNVFVSAYGFGGKPEQLSRAALGGEFELVTSPSLMAEVARVLSGKLGFDNARVKSVILQIARVADIVRPTQRLSVVRDEPDNRVLECAVEGGACVIVSGDRHVLDLGTYGDIEIRTVTEATVRFLTEEGHS